MNILYVSVDDVNILKGLNLEINDLKNKLKKGIPIPLFAFTGIDFISGYGKSINYNSLSVVSVESNFSSLSFFKDEIC